MKKYKLTVNETLRYSRELVIEIPTDVTLGQIDEVLNRAERGYADTAEDVGFMLIQAFTNAKIVENVDRDFSSPVDTDIEITELDEI